LRHVKGSPHAAQIFCGRFAFLTILGILTADKFLQSRPNTQETQISAFKDGKNEAISGKKACRPQKWDRTPHCCKRCRSTKQMSIFTGMEARKQ
jgi:hypothetical protein